MHALGGRGREGEGGGSSGNSRSTSVVYVVDGNVVPRVRDVVLARLGLMWLVWQWVGIHDLRV